jgi:magnesium transporter
MLTAYTCSGASLRPLPLTPGAPLPDEALWIDLVRPSEEEESLVERAAGVDVPTLDEMQEIEISSRLYEEGGAYFMTAVVLARSDTGYPEADAISFIIVRGKLITVRYIEPHAFKVFLQRSERQPVLCSDGSGVLLGLLETIVDRIADLLERIGGDVDGVSRLIFTHANRGGKKSPLDYQRILGDIGRYTDVVSRAQDSILSIDRLVTYHNEAVPIDMPREMRSRFKVLRRDLASLREHATALMNKTTFLLDATLGLVSIEQNAIIKIFSVAAVGFMPPTLVASIYGMNFDHMPELHWDFGYPMALGLMVVSAILPYLYFKRRGWL